MDRRDFLKTGAVTGLGAVTVGTGQGATGPPDNYQEQLDSMDGDGSESTPYVIETAADLQAIAGEADTHYELGSDVDATETADWHGASGFAPIDEFTGTLDGTDHEIRGLTIDRSDPTNVGLIDRFEGTARNLTLADVDISGENRVGALAGDAYGATVENVEVSGTVRGNSKVGGLLGISSSDYTTGSMTGCTSASDVQGGGAVGGLIGHARGEAASPNDITDCVATGPVSGRQFVGGVLGKGASAYGERRSVEVRNCEASGPVSSVGGDDAGFIGGLVGRYTDCAIFNSRATGPVDGSGAGNVGGLVGQILNPGGEIIASYATGDVEGRSRVGGLAGYAQGAVERCYATGDVSGERAVGGLVGELKEGVLTDAYAHGDVTSDLHAGGVVGIIDNFHGQRTAIRRTLATGAIDGVNDDDISTDNVGAEGGVVGKKGTDANENATTSVGSSYWDTETTGLDWGVGVPRNEDVLPEENGVPTADLQGTGASGTLAEFDFEDVWQISGGYPVLQAIEGNGGVTSCGIDTSTIELDPYPVETGARPNLSLVIPNADSATLRAEYQTPTGGTKEIERSLEVEDESVYGGTLWTTSRPLDATGRVGTWIDLTVEVEEDGDTCRVENLNNPYLDESTDFGYYVFDHVMSAVVILGRFRGQEPSSTTNPEIIQRWARARELDTNRFYGSERGAMGAVGFDLTFEQDGDDFYELPNQRSDYSGNPANTSRVVSLEPDDPTDSARERFLADLNDAAADVAANNDYDFWIGVHAGDPLNGTAAIYYQKGRVYAPNLLEDSAEDGFWPHEFGHVYGLDHTYNKGMDNSLCVMAEGDRNAAGVPADIPHPAPFSTPLRIARRTGLTTPGRFDKSDHLRDWLSVDATTVGQVDGDELELPAVNTLSYDDTVPVVESSHTVESNVGFIAESRPFVGIESGTANATEDDIAWDRENGAAVVYRQTKGAFGQTISVSEFNDNGGRNLGILEETGDAVTDRVGHGTPLELTFELEAIGDKEASPEAFSTTVSATSSSAPSDSRTMAVSGSVSGPGSGGVGSGDAEFTTPSLDLHAVDSEGRHVGVTDDGGYETEIPGARASGKRAPGMEWISVPADADVDFTVRSDDVEQYIEELTDAGYLVEGERSVEGTADEADGTATGTADGTSTAESTDDQPPTVAEFRQQLSVTYRASETRYGPDAQLTRDDGGAWVADTTLRVQEQSLDPGAEANPEPRNERSDLDIRSLDHDGGVGAESVTFEPVAGDDVDVGGWTLSNNRGDSYEFPAETTVEASGLVVHSGSGTDTDTELYWERSEQVWTDDGGALFVRDEDGAVTLAVSYDDRGVLRYGAEPSAGNAGDGSLLAGWLPELGVAGAGLASVATLYAAVRMRSSGDGED